MEIFLRTTIPIQQNSEGQAEFGTSVDYKEGKWCITITP